MSHQVLIVDDDRDIREALSLILEEEGCVVREASNGREALSLLRHEALPCLVFLDLMMPVMDGWQFLDEREKDERLRQLPVVVLTASGRPLTPGQRAAEVLPKPLRAEQIAEAVGTYC
jgi:CheY-like chemotaxis protein